MENFKKLPVIALRSMTILPDTMIHFDLIRKKSILAAEQAMSEDQEVFLVTQCHAETEDPQAEDLYQIGCIAKVKQVTKLPDNLVRVLVEGVCRGRLRTLFGEWEWLGGDIEVLEVPAMDESRKEAMLRSARDRFTEYCKYYPRTGRTLLRHMEEIHDPGKLMDQIIENIPADYTVKQKILEQVDLESRFEALAEVLATEVEVARIRTDLTEKVRERVDKNQKDYILREQLKYIQEELGEDDASDAALYEEKLQQLKASKEVKEKIAKEISRFKRLSTNSAESGVERAYIETLLELPWDKTSRETSDLTRAEEILDRDHYGLEQVKERMLEFLAVRALTKQGESPIICLVGPPGTGKTLLAKAVAGEADVPFFSISGSDFMEMFVGVGASRVRDLFNTAKRCAPAIVFIDEIDAVGRQRGTGLGGGHDEREQTLNQLLVEMDGFAPNEGIIVMAATNRADVLDPALLRPGRFDRQITVYPPDRKGRFEILKVHSRNKPLSAEVDLDQMAKRTPGFTGADLENILNEAAILSARKNKREITPDELEEAVSRVTMGPEKRSRVITEADKRITAYHEAGHAVVQHKLAKKEKIQEISIIPRGEAAGYTVSLPENDEMHVSKGKLLDFIAMLLGGRVAEEVALDDISTGASNDLQRASELARRMVTEWGMSDRIGPVCLASREEIFIGREWGHRNNYSEEIAARVDAEVRHILDEQYERARHTLEENRAGVDAVAKALIEYERLSGEEFEKVFSGEPVDLDKRADKRAEQVEQAAQSDSNLPDDTEKGRLNPDGSRTSD